MRVITNSTVSLKLYHRVALYDNYFVNFIHFVSQFTPWSTSKPI